MYNAQSVVENIQSALKNSDVSQKRMLSDCGISENALNQMNDKRGMSSFYLARIADYLGVSVDYLLGREQQSSVQISSDSRISDLISKISTLDDDQIRRLTAYVDGMIGE